MTTDFKKIIQEAGDAYNKRWEDEGFVDAGEDFNAGATEFVKLALECDEVMAMREALEMGAFHHDACPWLRGQECCCANSKRIPALANFDQLLQSLKEDK